jgi:signal transduction histidine kinase
LPSKGREDLKMATILVVDDKASNRSVLTTLLGYRGHRLVEASNGSEALDIVRTEHPDLVITDILMPGIDGYQLARQLREDATTNNVSVIFYSAVYLEAEARSLARACGVCQVICKPAEPEEILRIVDTALAPGYSNASPLASEELPGLISSLNARLYNKVQEYEELNNRLEDLVANRTQELETTLRKLERETEERRKADETTVRVREEQLKMKGEFLSHVSHELRSPLAVVYQFTTILLDGLAGTINESQREYLEITLRNVNQLKHMIGDLLEASRADIGKLTVRKSSISILPTMNQALESLRVIATTKQISLQADVSDHLPPVYADPDRVSQVLTNLLDNAIKFSQPNASVTVGARIFESDPKFVLISVADCGCGIERDYQDRIFERLYQVTTEFQGSRRGLGLGLYICKELITLHGGRIWVDSQPGKGSTLFFTLPLFGLRDIIAPIMKEGCRLPSSLALITIELHAAKASFTGQERQRTSHSICQLLERCTLPDLDVLLPPQNQAGRDRFWIVSRANEHGADVLASRIRGQLLHCEDLKINDVRYSVYTEMVKPELQGNNWPWAKYVDSIVSRLEEMLRTDAG